MLARPSDDEQRSDDERLLALAALAARRTRSRFGHQDPIGELNDQAQWFCLQTTPREEGLAAGGLVGHRFKVYLPKIWVTVRHGQGGPARFREEHRPMFPSYLFVFCLPRADHFGRVRNIPGVQRFLGGESPEPMPAQAIDAIQFDEAIRAKPDERRALRWPFMVGEQVRIKTGPFADFLAKIHSAVDEHGRIGALIELFGRPTVMKIEADNLEKL